MKRRLISSAKTRFSRDTLAVVSHRSVLNVGSRAASLAVPSSYYLGA
ncbi:MAG: hypothetical protein RL385_273 [Pseudomonadota bacterium]